MTRAAEQQLVELLKMADPEAISYWFTQYHGPILRFCKKRIESGEDAEEVAQATFLNCLRNLPLYLGNAKLLTWMFSIAHHEVADYYRKKYAKRAIKTLPMSEFLLSSGFEQKEDVSEAVARVLQKMSANSRELLLKKYVDLQKIADIAAELGQSIKAVESALFRARREFRELYGAQ